MEQENGWALYVVVAVKAYQNGTTLNSALCAEQKWRTMRNKGICRDCRHWGYNNRKPMNDVGESICLQLKRKTHACSHCKHFKQKKRWWEE